MKMKKIFSKICALALTVLMLVSITACKYQVNAQALSDAYARNVSGNFGVSDTFSDAAKSFAIRMFSDVMSADGENTLVSPLSAIYCIALLANGANGETLTQIEQALDIDLATLNESAYAYMNGIYSDKKCKLCLANSVWYNNSDEKLNISPEFLQTNANWYNSDIFAADFDSTTVKDINKWCSDKTFNMIEQIISQISPDTLMYLFNTIAFDSKWAQDYKNTQIKSGIFNNYNGTTSNVQMMHSSENIYFEYENAKGFAKNYAGDAYSFVGILPDESVDIYEFASSVDLEFWNNLLGSKTYCEVNLKMPEFAFETDIMDLTDMLKSMGITQIFDESNADFTKMGTSPLGNLYVDTVFQKACIDVSRNGTKAAVITGVGMDATSAEPGEIKSIILDRPFIYAIIDNQTNIPLFMGITSTIQ